MVCASSGHPDRSNSSGSRPHPAAFVTYFEKTTPKVEQGFEEAMSVIVRPERYRTGLCTTHRQERLNDEVRRREQVCLSRTPDRGILVKAAS
ncbi:MAG: transposase [Acidiferrobacteraceae bacterium]